MDGLAAVTARIAHIETRIESITAGRSSSVAAGSPASATAFAGVLDRALVEPGAGTGVSPSAVSSVQGWGTAAGVLGLGGAGGLGAAGATVATGAVNAKGVPVDLAAYGNGHVPASALTPVGSTGHRLWAPAAQGLERLLAAAAADGVTIGINDSYRSYDRQVEMVERKGLLSEGGFAAVPGTSRHGWGQAVDLRLDGPAQAWMRANAEKFGFVEDTPREPWHWGFYVDRVAR